MEILSVGLLALATFAASTAAPAQARVPAQDAGPLASSGTVTVQVYEADKRTLVSTKAVAMADSGTGGSSSASGCKKVTLNNEGETLLGFTAYRFHTWASWCWRRSTQTVYDVKTGWFLSDVDSFQVWRGMVNREFVFYDYSVNDGHPRSAYKHYRQGHFENCVPKVGCLSNTYPTNTLRSYYNGTYAWELDI